MTALTRDPMLRHNAWCLCRGCGKYFTEIGSFDAHRVGGKDCKPVDNMPNRFVRESSGHWRVIREVKEAT